jgi:hypothetical protein
MCAAILVEQCVDYSDECQQVEWVCTFDAALSPDVARFLDALDDASGLMPAPRLLAQ